MKMIMNEYMATGVMGWHKESITCFINGKEDTYWCWFDSDGNRRVLNIDWHPADNYPDSLNQAMMCVEMADTDILIAKDRVSWGVNGYRCETRDDIPLTICNAILEANCKY